MLGWLKRALVTLAAALTFGTVVPNSHVSTDRSQSSKSNRLEGTSSEKVEVESSREERSESNTVPSSWHEVATAASDASELRTNLPKFTVTQAERQGFEKFGPVISEQVGDEYRNLIVPKIGEVMNGISRQYDEETLRNLVVSQSPSGGSGEKILHIYDGRSGQDLVRFHVRRDHPPKDGYWFNFHYHVDKDQFETHHNLGNIYWDKDTPPQWRA